MKIQPVIIAFNSYGWTQRAIQSFFNYYPDRKVLVVDNNPPVSKDHLTGRWSYGNIDFKDSQQERKWLDRRDNLVVIDHPEKDTKALRHCDGLDLARDWCIEHGADAMFHFEPDCEFRKGGLLEKVSRKLEEGYWLVGVHRIKAGGGIWTAGSTWLLDSPAKKFSFCPRPIGRDSGHPLFDEMFDFNLKKGRWRTMWDTGQKIWYECESKRKAWAFQDSLGVKRRRKTSRIVGFFHEFHGTLKEFHETIEEPCSLKIL